MLQYGIQACVHRIDYQEMKKIWQLLVGHIRVTFDVRLYGLTLLVLAFALALNYQYDFHDRYLDQIPGMLRVAGYMLYYGIVYYTVVVIVRFTRGHDHVALSKRFWTTSLAGIAILSLDSGFPYMRDIVSAIAPERASYWAYKVGINVMSFVTVLLPAGIFYLTAERVKSRFYGFVQFHFDWKPYVTMLLIMVPLIAGASFLPSFRNFYPMYPVTAAHEALGTPTWVPTLIYELAYGADFITVEFLFRGFLVIGMIPLLGRDAILPMVAVYCLLHFGKPAGEAISSIAGGFILGVIAYETRSIWGGIAVHVGIAWLMELAAWLQQLARTTS